MAQESVCGFVPSSCPRYQRTRTPLVRGRLPSSIMVRLGEVIPEQAQTFLSEVVDASKTVADELAIKMRREAFTAANGAKFERELDEKYGVLKDVILHPTMQV